MAGRGLVSACLGGAVASFGCSALLDLDVQYTDAGSKGETDAAASAADASSEIHPDEDSTAPEAANRDGDRDAGTSPGVPDGSSPDVSNDAPPAPPIQYVQSVAGTNDYKGAVVTVTFANPVSLNDTIIVAADGMTTSLGAPTDSRGNPFSTVTSVLNPNLNGNVNGNAGSWIFYAPVVTPGSDSITVVLPGTPSGPLLNVYALEYSGVGALDGATGQNGTTTEMHSGFVTTTAPGDLIFGYGVTSLGSTNVGAGFMAHPSVHDLIEDEIAPGPGTVEATGTLATGNAWTMMVAAFKAR
jgi:hypothetical protein